MQNATYGGLAGRARKIRDRNRAERLYARQLIAECLDPEPLDPRRERFIPIRRCSDFLPSVANVVLHQSTGKERQLDLPWATSERAESAGTSNGKGSRSRDLTERVKDPVPPGEQRSAPTKPKDVRRAIAQEIFALNPRARRNFSIHGFLYGCLLGGGAAAVILLGIRLVL